MAEDRSLAWTRGFRRGGRGRPARTAAGIVAPPGAQLGDTAQADEIARGRALAGRLIRRGVSTRLRADLGPGKSTPCGQLPPPPRERPPSPRPPPSQAAGLDPTTVMAPAHYEPSGGCPSGPNRETLRAPALRMQWWRPALATRPSPPSLPRVPAEGRLSPASPLLQWFAGGPNEHPQQCRPYARRSGGVGMHGLWSVV
jgi:hypothetical protein